MQTKKKKKNVPSFFSYQADILENGKIFKLFDYCFISLHNSSTKIRSLFLEVYGLFGTSFWWLVLTHFSCLLIFYSKSVFFVTSIFFDNNQILQNTIALSLSKIAITQPFDLPMQHPLDQTHLDAVRGLI